MKMIKQSKIQPNKQQHTMNLIVESFRKYNHNLILNSNPSFNNHSCVDLNVYDNTYPGNPVEIITIKPDGMFFRGFDL